MKLKPEIRRRRSIRLKGYDYSQKGAYFVTICTHNRKCLLGEMLGEKIRLGKAGEIVADEWVKTTKIRHEVDLDTFVVMPNHFHAIVWLLCRGADVETENVSTVQVTPTKKSNQPVGPQPQSIGALMAGFKSAVTKRINKYQDTPGHPFWQRNYYEHVIRDEEELNRARQYMFMDNPKKWMEDEENPMDL
jgi:REP element-mobilizing transposase RayT